MIRFELRSSVSKLGLSRHGQMVSLVQSMTLTASAAVHVHWALDEPGWRGLPQAALLGFGPIG